MRSFRVSRPVLICALALVALCGVSAHAAIVTVPLVDSNYDPGSSYYPGTDGSDLVIRTNLLGPEPVSSTFKQHPTPEPAMVALLGFGLFGVFMRRRRQG